MLVACGASTTSADNSPSSDRPLPPFTIVNGPELEPVRQIHQTIAAGMNGTLGQEHMGAVSGKKAKPPYKTTLVQGLAVPGYSELTMRTEVLAKPGIGPRTLRKTNVACVGSCRGISNQPNGAAWFKEKAGKGTVKFVNADSTDQATVVKISGSLSANPNLEELERSVSRVFYDRLPR